MKDNKGIILTKPKDVLEETVNHYIKVLENRSISEGFEYHQKEREHLPKLRLEQAARNICDECNLNYKKKI